ARPRHENTLGLLDKRHGLQPGGKPGVSRGVQQRTAFAPFRCDLPGSLESQGIDFKALEVRLSLLSRRLKSLREHDHYAAFYRSHLTSVQQLAVLARP